MGEYWWLNPAYPEVRQLVADGVAEILAQYHVDGIHLDDYFYPTTETAFDAAAFADAKADDLGAFRLEQVNAMVQQIYSTVKAASPAIQLSISPQGTMDGNYTKQYADVRRWGTETGYCDVLIPQLYYGFANETAPFAEALQTWTETVSSESVSLVIGIARTSAAKRTPGQAAAAWSGAVSRRCPFVRQNWRWKQTERTASPSTTMKQPFNRTLPQMPCHRFERRWESCSGMGNKKAFCFNGGRATPYKARLLALYAICLSISRHTAQKFLDIRK